MSLKRSAASGQVHHDIDSTASKFNHRDKRHKHINQKRNGKKPQHQVNTAAGVSAILVSCDTGKEPLATREALRWINEVADELYPVEKSESVAAAAEQPAASVSSTLAAELSELQQADRRGFRDAQHQRFTRVKINLIGNVFIACTDPAVDTLPIVQRMCDQLIATKTLPTRYCIRMQPIQRTCFSSMECVEKLAQERVSDALKQVIATNDYLKAKVDAALAHASAALAESKAAPPPPPSFAIDYRKRGRNDVLQRDQLIPMLARCVPSPPFIVNLQHPDVVIRLDTSDRISGISVYMNHEKYCKFHIRDIFEKLTGIKQEIDAAKKHRVVTPTEPIRAESVEMAAT